MSDAKSAANLILEKFTKKPDYIVELEKAFDNAINGALKDVLQVVEKLSYDDAPKVLSEIIDIKTDTGLAEAVDGKLMDIAFGYMFKKFVPEEKYNKIQDRIISEINNWSAVDNVRHTEGHDL